MSERHPAAEIEIARQRLQRSRENLHTAFRGDGTGEGGPASSPLLRGLVLKGVQLLASGRGSPLSGIGPVISLATLLLTMFMRGRAKPSGVGLIGPIAIAALSLFRKR